jgi:tripartite-type tricarboxylate transporter receptor subunit TctC
LKTLVRSIAALGLLAFGAASVAQDYPNRPIRMLVSFPPGATADATARTFAAPLSQLLGQSIIVENRPGADGVIAADVVRKAAPDGYTLLFATSTAMAAAPTMRKNPPYDPVTDFTPVSTIGTFGFFLFAHQSVPANSFKELLSYIKANPGKLAYGTGNSTGVISMAQLISLQKLDMVHIPYKGDAPAVTDLVAGRVQLMFAAPASAMPHVQTGRLKVLATLLPKRSARLPDVPTTEEAANLKLTIVPWAGLFGPANMPKEVTDRLARASKDALAQRDTLDKLSATAFEGSSSTPEELRTLTKEQLEAWHRTLKQVGIAPE